jgi:hypothetical protein
MPKFANRLILLINTVLLSACIEPIEFGTLRVSGLGSGPFELYRIEGDPPQLYVSEQVGKFNEDLKLFPGSYLVLADCSHERVLIRPNENKTLVAHRVKFLPPFQASANDRFEVQCSRYEQLQFRQSVHNVFEFNVLDGKREILAGMTPYTIAPGTSSDRLAPENFEIGLAALRVSNGNSDIALHETPYFVTPVSSIISVTASQTFGDWILLLPGSYDIEVNGTHQEAILKTGDKLDIAAGALRLSAPPEVALDESTRILGSPISATINDDHFLEVNETLPVLPGLAKVQISGSQKVLDVELSDGEPNEIKLRSLEVDLGCSPWEWTCLGSQAVQLFEGDQHYPFLEMVTDVPILYPDGDISAGLLASSGIRHKLDPQANVSRLKAGRVKLIPKPIHRPGQITDLVRIETNDKSMIGHSRDIPFNEPTAIVLFAGEYRLAQYQSSTAVEGERGVKSTEFTVVPGETTTLEFPFLVSERAIKKILSEHVPNEGLESQVAKAPARVIPLRSF